jgi:hypothetical protein
VGSDRDALDTYVTWDARQQPTAEEMWFVMSCSPTSEVLGAAPDDATRR